MLFILLFFLFFDTTLGPSGSMNMVIMLSQFPGILLLFLFDLLSLKLNTIVSLIVIVLFQGTILFVISRLTINRILRDKEENEYYDGLRE